MTAYKVSYGVLTQQGTELVKLAKLVDGYAERVNAIKARLGGDSLLESVRGNLSRLAAQLGESRTVLNTAGSLLEKAVEGYSASETRQVKKVDSLKAHNRDFYKNPVVVASAGGAAAGAAGAAAGAAAGTTVNYTDHSTTLNYYAAPETAATDPGAGAVFASAGNAAQNAAEPAGTGGAGIAAAVGVAAGVAGAGLVEGALRLKGKKNSQAAQSPAPHEPEEDLDERLARARARVHALEEQDAPQG